MIAGLDVDEKKSALVGLDSLDRTALDAKGLAELSEAYRFLGRPDSALKAANLLSSRDERSSAGEIQSILSLAKAGDYASAQSAAELGLKRFPGDKNLLALYHEVKGRGMPSPVTAAPAGNAAILPVSEASAARSASTPLTPRGGLRRSTVVPPPPGGAILDPKAPDYWDRQLLSPLLRRSDGNAVAKEYLSPLIRAGKVTLRFVTPREDPSIAGAWGTYNPRTSIIKFNLDSVNKEISEHGSFYAKRSPERVVGAILPGKPMDAAQIEFVVGRFLPLAVHEAAGHGTHGDDLRRRLGTRSAPMNKDTEILSWRLEAAAIAEERRRDPSYLTEPTAWSRGEEDWLKVWKRSREMKLPEQIELYLDGMPAYSDLPNVSQDPKNKLPAIENAVALLPGRCRARYDAECAAAAATLVDVFPAKFRASLMPFLARLASHPEDARLRAEMINLIHQVAVVHYRLDPKGVSVVRAYYNEQERKVTALENHADPRNLWQSIMSVR